MGDVTSGFFSEMGLVGVLLAAVIQVLASSAIIWFVANKMMSLGEPTGFKKCILCTICLWVVMVVSLLFLIFVPIPLVNIVGAIVILYKGSIAAVEGSLDTTTGGLMIVILYLVVSLGINFVVKQLMVA